MDQCNSSQFSFCPAGSQSPSTESSLVRAPSKGGKRHEEVSPRVRSPEDVLALKEAWEVVEFLEPAEAVAGEREEKIRKIK